MENKITEIQIVPVKHTDSLVAFASFVFDNSFYFGSQRSYLCPHAIKLKNRNKE